MDKDAFLENIKKIGSMETPEEMRAELAGLSKSVSEVFDTNATLKEQHDHDTEEMEAIRQANMKLFTQLGTETTPAKQTEEQTGLKQEPVERRKFENLFDDKGDFIKKH